MSVSARSSESFHPRQNGRAILAMLIAMLGFIFNDIFVKLLAEALPLPTIIFFRSVIACGLLVLLGASLNQLAPIPRGTRGMVGLRSLGEMGASVFYLTALTLMPLANATAILQAIPLIMVACAALFLGEKVGWRRWSAVIVGFCGMLLVVQPGPDGYDQTVVIALLALASLTLRDLSTRFISNAIPSLMVTLVSMSAVALLGASWALVTGGFMWPNPQQWLMLTGGAVALSVGFWGITVGMRLGELATVAPFRYSIILWAILFGYLIWGDVPDPLRLVGIALIVGSGLFVIYRERVREQERAETP